MKISRSRFIRTMVATSLAVIAISSRAYADGVKSQWKMRVPMPTGLVLVERQEKVPAPSTLQKIQMAASEEKNIIKLIVKTKVRQQYRAWENRIVSTREDIPAEKVPMVAINDNERIRRIRTSMRPLNSCAMLHTHEKARCIRDQQYAKTKQYNFVVALRMESMKAAAPEKR